MKKLNFLSLFCLFLIYLVNQNQVVAQSETPNHLTLRAGLQHMNLLDLQAAPLTYQANGPGVELVFIRKNTPHWWQYSLGIGLLPFQPAEPEAQFRGFSFSGTYAGIKISHLRLVSEKGKWETRLGGAFQQELMLDFYGIGDFPWIFAQGGIYGIIRTDWEISPKHTLAGEFSLPIFSWLTDMPFNQIPRLEGRSPDVITILQTGTRIPNWGNYQRFDLDFSYTYNFHPVWSLEANYQWAWFHDSQPKDLWAYQQLFTIGITRKW